MKSQDINISECPVSDCHDRVERLGKEIDKKVSWRILVIMISILIGTVGVFIEGKVESIELHSRAIARLEERTRDIQEMVKVSVREVMLEFMEER